MKRLFVLILPVALMLIGCASKNDVAMMRGYYGANTAHNQEQTKQVASKATAIQRMLVFDCDDSDPNCAVARAMGGVVASMLVSNISPQEFTTKAPTTGVSVQEKAMGVVGSGIPWLTIGVVATKGIDSAGDETEASGGSTVIKADGDVSTSQVEEVVFEPEEEVIVDESATAE